MFYRPNFCCHCGEKIIRAKWTPLTSRRFCDFCAIEQKQHDLIPRAAAVVLILFGAAGLTAYFGGRSGAEPDRKSVSSKLRSMNSTTTSDRIESQPRATSTTSASTKPNGSNSAIPNSNNAQADSKQRGAERNSSTEAVYYCGAMTKKGTACTRRVKSLGRCWQHLGQPAINSPKN